ncbi:vegetative cell wall protein gp1-like [Panicum hallii]|uniref:vegetative cell wall protein gp1-like n=1 Tax=Panicum hallii TaxID=206008 RepID=UPI000DF4D766|nr:vegetative cell wall protein gp1-like [Panicum hallii]
MPMPASRALTPSRNRTLILAQCYCSTSALHPVRRQCAFVREPQPATVVPSLTRPNRSRARSHGQCPPALHRLHLAEPHAPRLACLCSTTTTRVRPRLCLATVCPSRRHPHPPGACFAPPASARRAARSLAWAATARAPPTLPPWATATPPAAWAAAACRTPRALPPPSLARVDRSPVLPPSTSAASCSFRFRAQHRAWPLPPASARSSACAPLGPRRLALPHTKPPSTSASRAALARARPRAAAPALAWRLLPRASGGGVQVPEAPALRRLLRGGPGPQAPEDDGGGGAEQLLGSATSAATAAAAGDSTTAANDAAPSDTATTIGARATSATPAARSASGGSPPNRSGRPLSSDMPSVPAGDAPAEGSGPQPAPSSPVGKSATTPAGAPPTPAPVESRPGGPEPEVTPPRPEAAPQEEAARPATTAEAPAAAAAPDTMAEASPAEPAAEEAVAAAEAAVLEAAEVASTATPPAQEKEPEVV